MHERPATLYGVQMGHAKNNYSNEVSPHGEMLGPFPTSTCEPKNRALGHIIIPPPPSRMETAEAHCNHLTRLCVVQHRQGTCSIALLRSLSTSIWHSSSQIFLIWVEASQDSRWSIDPGEIRICHVLSPFEHSEEIHREFYGTPSNEKWTPNPSRRNKPTSS